MRSSIVALSLLACACSAAQPAPSATPTAGRTVLAVLEGEFDPSSGRFTVTSEPTATGAAHGMSALTVDSYVTVSSPGGAWPMAKGHCTNTALDSGGGDVLIANGSSSRLDDVWAVIDTLSGTESGVCNATTSPPPLGLDTTYGVWSFGDIAAGASPSRPWAFTWGSSTKSIFRGHVVGSPVDSFAGKLSDIVSTDYNASVMTGTPSAAIFLEETALAVALVNASGQVTLSTTLSNWPVSVAVNGAGNLAWVGTWSSTIVAIQVPGGTRVGSEVSVATYPAFVTVDPNGVVWMNDNSAGPLRWYDPATTSTGTVAFTGTPGPMAAVSQGGNCRLYVADQANDRIRLYDCAGKSSLGIVSVASGCIYDGNFSFSLVPDASGAVWYEGEDGGASIELCKAVGLSATAEVALPYTSPLGVGYLAMGPDGNLWVTIYQGNAGNLNRLLRVWLGASGYGTATTMAVPATTAAGLAAGAGAIWLPPATSGALIRIVP